VIRLAFRFPDATYHGQPGIVERGKKKDSYNMRISYSARLAFSRILAGGRRNLMMIICMALGWLALGSFLLLFLNLRNAENQIKDEVQMEVYLNGDITSLQLYFLQKSLLGLPQVEQVEYRSWRNAFLQMEHLLGPEALAGLNAKALPSSFLLHLKRGHRSYQEVSGLAVRVRAWEGVEDVEYGGKWLKQAEQDTRTFSLGITVLGMMVTLALAAMVIGFTRWAARSQKNIVQVMSLLGASRGDAAILLLILGLVLGGAGALMGLAGLRVLHWLLASALSAHEFLPGPTIPCMIAAGAILGALGAIAQSSRNPQPEM
jgi:cell division transport system permease protein